MPRLPWISFLPVMVGVRLSCTVESHSCPRLSQMHGDAVGLRNATWACRTSTVPRMMHSSTCTIVLQCDAKMVCTVSVTSQAAAHLISVVGGGALRGSSRGRKGQEGDVARGAVLEARDRLGGHYSPEQSP